MKLLNNEAAQQVQHQNFNTAKKKSLIGDKSSFKERFSNWIAAYTKEANEKMWRDIEYFQAK